MAATLFPILLVGAGGACGAIARHGTYIFMTRWLGHGFPYGTLTVNIVGSFIMGLLVAILARHMTPHSSVHLFFAIGVLGSYTTFSTFSLDVVTLIQRGEILYATGYILASFVLSVTALAGGLGLVRMVD